MRYFVFALRFSEQTDFETEESKKYCEIKVDPTHKEPVERPLPITIELRSHDMLPLASASVHSTAERGIQ